MSILKSNFGVVGLSARSTLQHTRMGVDVPRDFQEHAQASGGLHPRRARNRILERRQEAALSVRGSSDITLRGESIVPPVRLSADLPSPLFPRPHSIRDVHLFTMRDLMSRRSIVRNFSMLRRSWNIRVTKFGKCSE